MANDSLFVRRNVCVVVLGFLCVAILCLAFRHDRGRQPQTRVNNVSANDASKTRIALSPENISPVETTADQGQVRKRPVLRPAAVVPVQVKNKLAASLAGALTERYNVFKQRDELAEAKGKALIDKDPDVAQITEMKLRQVSAPARVFALTDAMNDPLFQTMFRDMLQDQTNLGQMRDIFKQVNDVLGMNLPFSNVNSADELIPLIQQSQPFLQKRCDTLYSKLGIDPATAAFVEDGASSGMITQSISQYMSDAGWHYDATTKSFVQN